MLRRLSFAALTLLLSVGCQGPRADVHAVLSIASAQLADFEYVGVDAIQGEQTFAGVETSPGVVRLEVPAGVTTTIRALLLDATDHVSLLAFAGATDITPVAGEQSVDVAATVAGSAQVTLRPQFTDPGSGNPVDLLGVDFDLTATDVATGTPVTVRTGEPFDVATGRAIHLTGSHPKAAGVSVDDTVTVAPGVTEVAVDLGAPPDKPRATFAVTAIGDGVVNIDDVTAAPGYETDVQCAFIQDCPAAIPSDCCPADSDSAWGACDQTAAQPPVPNLEGDYYLAVHYVTVPGSCTVFSALFDRTPPRVDVSLDPPFLGPGVTINPTLYILGNESLRATALIVTVDGAGTNLCPTPDDLDTELDCLDMALTGSPGNGVLSLRVAGEDLAGNPFDITVPYQDLSSMAPATTADVVVSRFETFPQPADPQSMVFPIAIELANIGNSDACSVNMTKITVDDASGTPVVGLLPYWDLKLPTIRAGEIERFWGRIQVNYPGEAPGDYVANVDVEWVPCVPGALTAASASLPFNLVLPPVRWLTNDTIKVAEYQQYASTTLVHRGGFRAGESPPPFSYSSDDRTVFSMDPLTPDLLPKGIGTATATVANVSPFAAPAPSLTQQTGCEAVAGCVWDMQSLRCLCPFESDAVRVEVVPSPDLLVLRGGMTPTWHRVRPGELLSGSIADPGTPVDAGIGAPLNLLWDSMRDSVTVVGDQGLELFGPSPPVIVTTPCGLNGAAGDRILDAALTAVAPGHSRAQPDIAVIVNKGGSRVHCEIDPDTGADAAGPFALAGTCVPERLIVDPVSGEITVFGIDTTPGRPTECALAYTTRTGALPSFTAGLQAGSGAIGGILDVEVDPFGRFAAALVDNSAAGVSHGVDGWNLGAMLATPGQSSLVGCGFGVGIPDAIAVDPASGDVTVAISDNGMECGATSTVHRSLRTLHARSGGFTPATDSTYRPETTTTRTTALAVDPNNDRVYVGDDQGNLITVPLNGLYGFDTAGVVPLPGAAASILDLVVAGPKPLWPSVSHAHPGQVVTVAGLGFNGVDDGVFVQGLSAAVLHRTPNAITFEVPWELENLDGTLYDTRVTVESHGFMSGPAINGLTILPRPVGYSEAVAKYSQRPAGCSLGTCNWTRLIYSDDFQLRQASDVGYTIVGYSDWGSLTPLQATYTGLTPRTLLATRADHDLLGRLDTDQWWTSRHYFNPQLSSLTIETPVTTPAGANGPSLLAVSSAQDIAAVSYSGSRDVSFFFGTSLDAHPADQAAGLFGAGDPVAALAFDRSGTVLLVASAAGALTAIDTRQSPAGLLGINDDNSVGCPTPTSLVTLSPYGDLEEATLVTTGGGYISVWAIKNANSGTGTAQNWRRQCLSTAAAIPSSVGVRVAVAPLGNPLAIAQWDSVNTFSLRLADRNDLAGDRIAAPLSLNFAPLDMMFSPSAQQLHVAGASADQTYELANLPYSR